MPKIWRLKWQTHDERRSELNKIEEVERAKAKVADAKGDKVGEAYHTGIANLVGVERKHEEMIEQDYCEISKNITGIEAPGRIVYKTIPTRAPNADKVHEEAKQMLPRDDEKPKDQS